jgi:hypothetical protein
VFQNWAAKQDDLEMQKRRHWGVGVGVGWEKHFENYFPESEK